MILSHEGWLLSLLQPSAAARRRVKREETFIAFFLFTLCRDIHREVGLLQQRDALVESQRKKNGDTGAITLSDLLLMWDLQRLSRTVE